MPSTTRFISKHSIHKLLCLLALALLLPAAGLATNVGDSLVVGIQSTKTTQILPLDPQERDLMSVYDLVYESLITIDDNYLPTACLAESWECSSNGRSWTFHLRKELYFSDGSPLTAYDVVATAQHILTRASDENSSNRGYYQNLRYDLLKTLRSLGVDNVIREKRGSLAINRDMVSCDYYDYLDGRLRSVAGEYMPQYEFVEFTRARLAFTNH